MDSVLLAATSSAAAVWSAVAAWLTLALVGVSLWFVRRQVLEAKKTREEQSRPFVVVDFDLDTGTHIIPWWSRTSERRLRGAWASAGSLATLSLSIFMSITIRLPWSFASRFAGFS